MNVLIFCWPRPLQLHNDVCCFQTFSPNYSEYNAHLKSCLLYTRNFFESQHVYIAHWTLLDKDSAHNLSFLQTNNQLDVHVRILIIFSCSPESILSSSTTIGLMSYSNKPTDYYRAHTFSRAPSVPSSRNQNVNSWPPSMSPNTWQFQSQLSPQANYGAFPSTSYESHRNVNNHHQIHTNEPMQVPNLPLWPVPQNDTSQPVPPNPQSFNSSSTAFSPPSIAGFSQALGESLNEFPRVSHERYNNRRAYKASFEQHSSSEHTSKRVDNRKGKERVLRACACGHLNHIRKNHCDQCGRAKAPPKKRSRKPSLLGFDNWLMHGVLKKRIFFNFIFSPTLAMMYNLCLLPTFEYWKIMIVKSNSDKETQTSFFKSHFCFRSWKVVTLLNVHLSDYNSIDFE